MNRELLREELAQAEREVCEGEAIVARQRGIVARMAALGGDPRIARELLAAFERTQSLSVADRDRLRKLLTNQRRPSPLSG